MSCGCRQGARRTQDTGDGHKAIARQWREPRLRYKMSTRRKLLKALALRKPWRNLRYKISGASNRLF